MQLQLDYRKAVKLSTQPDLLESEYQLERAQELYDRDSLSQIELMRAENKVKAAKGKYDAAVAQEKLAAYYLSQAVIRAPVSGLYRTTYH